MITTVGTTTTTMTTTNRSDFTWPRLEHRQRVFDWDRYEFKARRLERKPWQPPQWFRSPETLEFMPFSRRLRFDFGHQPKPILGTEWLPRHSSDNVDNCCRPSKRAIEYDEDREAERIAARSSRPRVLRCPQISLDDVQPADRRDALCAYAYTTTKTMSELTSGVPPPPTPPRTRPIIHVDAPSKPFDCGPGQFQPLPLYKIIKPPKNWRRVSIEWDKSQRRIFGS